MNEPVPILREGKIVALVHAGILFRAFRSRVGIQRYPFLGIAFDLDILRQATKAGATRIKLFDRDTGDTIETEMELFRKQGEYNPENREQWIMKLNKWTRRERGEEDQEFPAQLATLDQAAPSEGDYARARAAIVKASKGERRVSGETQCPICLKQLRYNVASNGHIAAQCSTETCVRWME